MKNILIIGGCGYIGSVLFEKFKNTHHVDTVDLEWFGNYVNPLNLKKDFADLTEEFLDKYDVVIHVAANSSVALCKNVFDSFENNVTKFVGLVKKLKKQKFIYASSSCVYVTSDNLPKNENDLLIPLDGLTLSKTTIDHFMPLTDVEFYGLRFGSVNGWSPNMRLDLMINSMTISGEKNGQVIVMNGHAHRPILSTNDLVRAVDTIVNTEENNRGVYNLASVNHNIAEIGKKVADYLGVELIDNGNNYTYDFAITSQKFMDTFNFTFNDTVETIIESIKSNRHNYKWTKREVKQI